MIEQACLKHRIIEEADRKWFRYALEKRITSSITMALMIAIGSCLSSLVSVGIFAGVFCYIRKRTNGYHAKTFLGCMAFSLISEVILFGYIYPCIAENLSVIVVISALLIVALAPYNHPAMHLNSNEFKACRRSALLRLVLILFAYYVAYKESYADCIKGISLGILFAAVSLCMAHINGKDETNELVKKSN